MPTILNASLRNSSLGRGGFRPGEITATAMKERGLKGHKDHGKSLPEVEKGPTGTSTCDAILLTHLALLPPSALLSPLASITPFHAIRFRTTPTRPADKVEILDPSTHFPPWNHLMDLHYHHPPPAAPNVSCFFTSTHLPSQQTFNPFESLFNPTQGHTTLVHYHQSRQQQQHVT